MDVILANLAPNLFKEQTEKIITKQRLKKAMRNGAVWLNNTKVLHDDNSFDFLNTYKNNSLDETISYRELVRKLLHDVNSIQLVKYIRCVLPHYGEVYHKLLFKENHIIHCCIFHGFDPIWYTQLLGNFLTVSVKWSRVCKHYEYFICAE